MNCTYCGSRLHTKTNCPKTWQGSVNRLHLHCTYCGGKDHNKNACSKRHITVTYKLDDNYILDK